jgi:hypothetical protein
MIMTHEQKQQAVNDYLLTLNWQSQKYLIHYMAFLRHEKDFPKIGCKHPISYIEAKTIRQTIDNILKTN